LAKRTKLWGADRRIKPLPEGDRSDAIEFAMQHQSRDRDRADRDVGGGGERHFQNEPPDQVFARERHGDASAKRFTPDHDPFGGVVIRTECICCVGV
jgi:hypothetical protein